MGHSVSDDLYFNARRTREVPLPCEQLWNGLVHKTSTADEILAVLYKMSSADRFFFYHNDPLAHAVLSHATDHVIQGMLVAQVSDLPQEREAYEAAGAWAWNVRLCKTFLLQVVEECLVQGNVVAWAEHSARRVGIASPKSLSLKNVGSRLCFSVGDGPLFGSCDGEFVYSLACNGDLGALRSSMASFVDAVLRDALAVIRLDRFRPRVGFLGRPDATQRASMAEFPDTNGLPAMQAAPLAMRWLAPHFDVAALRCEDVRPLEHVSGVLVTDE
jgi:hypothetical protein